MKSKEDGRGEEGCRVLIYRLFRAARSLSIRSRTRGRSQGVTLDPAACESKRSLHPLCFLLRGKDDPPRKESIGEERRRIDLSPPSTLLEIRPRDLSLRGNCIRITSCHSRYHIQPSSSSSWKLLGKLLGIEIFGHPFIGSMDRLALGIFPRNVSWPPRWSCRRREILLQRVWYFCMYKRKEGLCVEFSVWNIRETWSIVNFCWDKIRNKN